MEAGEKKEGIIQQKEVSKQGANSKRGIRK